MKHSHTNIFAVYDNMVYPLSHEDMMEQMPQEYSIYKIIMKILKVDKVYITLNKH